MIPSALRSIQLEGLGMLQAVASDFARLSDIEVEVIWDSALGPCQVDRVRAVGCTPDAFRSTAASVLGRCDAAFVIAPESNGILADHCRLVGESEARWLGCTEGTIELCADKLRLAERLEQCCVPTVPTSEPTQPVTWPIVLKPRFGAGCEDTFLIRNESEYFESVRMHPGIEFIQQPYVGAESCSVAAILSAAGMVSLPCVWQRIEEVDRQLRYAGGCLEPTSSQCTIPDSLVRSVLDAAGIDNGWIGIDFMLPHGREPLVVDVNPRLTTSYAAYRAATKMNLASLILGHAEDGPAWLPGRVEFDKSGRVSP